MQGSSISPVASVPPRAFWTVAALVVMAIAIGVLGAFDAGLLFVVSLIPFFLGVFLRRPELSLAIVFNGSLLFFYSLSKLGHETSFLVTGGFYAVLTLSYSLPLLLFFANDRIRVYISSVDMLFASLFIWLFLSYLLLSTANPLATMKVLYAPFMVVGPYIAVRCLFSEIRVKRFFDFCILTGVVLLGASFYELLTSEVLTQPMRFSIYAFSEHGVNPIAFGITFSVVLLIALVRLCDGCRHVVGHLLIVASSAWLVLRSGSRGALTSLCVSIIFYLVFLARRSWVVRMGTLLAILILFGVGVVTLPQRTRGFYEYSISHKASVDEASSIYRRIHFWRTAWADFRENPLTGVGTGNSVGGLGYPHNIVLEVLAEHGILGFALFAGLCYATLRKGLMSVKRERSAESTLLPKLALTLFVYSLSEALFSNYFTRQTQLFVTVAMVASFAYRRPACRSKPGAVCNEINREEKASIGIGCAETGG